MQLNELVDKWLRHYNEKYTAYVSSESEPRYYFKHFFLYSYHFLCTLQKRGDWTEYVNQFDRLFRREPTKDWYGRRSPVDSQNARANSLEWAAIFEIVNLFGYPYNKSAKEKMLINAGKCLEEAKSSPEKDCRDIMICSAIEFLPAQFGNHEEWLATWVAKYLSKDKPTPHQIIAYLNALKEPKHENLRNQLSEILHSWIKNPEGDPKRQLLIWARIFNRLNLHRDTTLYDTIRTNFFRCLRETFFVDWSNLPLILDTVYKLSDDKTQKVFYDKISMSIVPPQLFQLKEIFPFLEDHADPSELQKEVEGIREKCEHYQKNACDVCIEKPQGECWIRILAKLTGRKPSMHGPLEVADFVIYTFDKGIYFVIKAEPITRSREGGNTLFRQCVKCFSSGHALVFYWNPHKTDDSVLEQIRQTAALMETKPQFIIVEPKYIRQVYQKYKESE
jgi:hypothetical protein